ncbi:MAG TPA: hypothetical protein VFE62_20685, partial [Gemmataceae bacterium]|nr:hypothetical protein [Gemmataceae bacterium]
MLSHSAKELGVLLVLTYCSDDVDGQRRLQSTLPLLIRESSAIRLDLEPLSASESNELLETLYPAISVDIPELPRALHIRSGGSPLFLIEFMRFAVDEKWVWRDADGVWKSRECTSLPVPPLVRQMIEERVGRLADDAVGLLSIAALIGMEVPFTLWAPLAQRAPDSLHRLLDDADAANLVRQDAAGKRFQFTQTIIREALVDVISLTQRRQFHRKIAEALLAYSTTDPETIAHHFVEASDDRAVTWIIHAAERAELAHEWSRATQLYKQAIDALGNSEEPRTRGWLYLAIAALDEKHAMASVGKAISQARLAFDQHLAAWALALQGRLFCEIGALREGLADWVAGLERIEALPDSDRRWNLRERAVYRRTDPGLLSGYLTLAGRFSDARQWISRRPFFTLRMNYEGLDSDTEFESWCLASI